MGRTAPHIRVNAACPCHVLTPVQRAEYSERQLAEQAGVVPLQRLGAPEVIAP